MMFSLILLVVIWMRYQADKEVTAYIKAIYEPAIRAIEENIALHRSIFERDRINRSLPEPDIA